MGQYSSRHSSVLEKEISEQEHSEMKKFFNLFISFLFITTHTTRCNWNRIANELQLGVAGAHGWLQVSSHFCHRDIALALHVNCWLLFSYFSYFFQLSRWLHQSSFFIDIQGLPGIGRRVVFFLHSVLLSIFQLWPLCDFF